MLVIDDDDAIRFVACEALRGAGFEVTEAASGLLGLDLLDREPPSLVLLDIMMPGIDGFQVMQVLQKFEVRVPVLVFSALGDKAAERAHEVGADDFLAKPFSVVELLTRCRRLVEDGAPAQVRADA